MNKTFGLKWAVVMAGAMLLVLVAACGAGKEIASYDCDELRSDIIKLSEELRAKNPTDRVDANPVILFINDDVKETERTEKRLSCDGTARLNSDGRITGPTTVQITYHVEKDAAGDISKRYETY